MPQMQFNSLYTMRPGHTTCTMSQDNRHKNLYMLIFMLQLARHESANIFPHLDVVRFSASHPEYPGNTPDG